MDSLEFIDEEIKYCKKELEENKQNCLVNKNDKALVIGRNLYLRKKLRALNQIKTELEAWEVVKEELQIVSRGKNRRGEKLQRYELCVIGQDKINTLNKGLEVEDE